LLDGTDAERQAANGRVLDVGLQHRDHVRGQAAERAVEERAGCRAGGRQSRMVLEFQQRLQGLA
jgi:hypothetical protein